MFLCSVFKMKEKNACSYADKNDPAEGDRL